jgi:hypothetical protein
MLSVKFALTFTNIENALLLLYIIKQPYTKSFIPAFIASLSLRQMETSDATQVMSDVSI